MPHRSRYVVVMVLLGLAPLALAQFRQSQRYGQPSNLNVTIIMQDGAPLGELRKTTQVQLQDGTGIRIEDQMPDDQGKARFRIQLGSIYRIRVFGPDVLETMVDNIDPETAGAFIHVRVARKPDTSMIEPSNDTVSVARLNVPPKARKELDKGNEALGKGDVTKAQKHFRSALQIYPEYDLALNNLGVVLMQVNDLPGGKAAFEKALAISPEFARANVNLARILLREKQFAQAEVHLRRAAQIEPLNAQIFFLSAQALMSAGNLEEGIAQVKKMHELSHGKFAMGHVLAARAYERQSKPESALVEYELFLKESPSGEAAAAAQQRVKELQQAKN